MPVPRLSFKPLPEPVCLTVATLSSPEGSSLMRPPLTISTELTAPVFVTPVTLKVAVFCG